MQDLAALKKIQSKWRKAAGRGRRPRAAWTGWIVDTSAAYLGEVGQCAGLDKSTWGSSITDFVDAYEWGVGVGPLSTDISDYLESHYTTKWKVWSSQFIGGYLYTDVAGSSDVYGMNYGYVFETDEDGELQVDSDGELIPLDAAEESDVVDGRYRTYPFFGFSL